MSGKATCCNFLISMSLCSAAQMCLTSLTTCNSIHATAPHYPTRRPLQVLWGGELRRRRRTYVRATHANWLEEAGGITGHHASTTSEVERMWKPILRELSFYFGTVLLPPPHSGSKWLKPAKKNLPTVISRIFQIKFQQISTSDHYKC